ncbi:NAD(P)-dependent oxidoreductase [Acidocella sp.]|uniref:NAD-dependent epimerase/dehydratase family protein n=1 Tax=Acidocella sp. TaxID=50710 RepID=UPI00261EF90A|nr:NAD-dependent epimerase/dehydratase family protein [Acidocella sp.]
MTAPRAALTGASGFLGGHVLAGLRARGVLVRALARRDVALAAEIVRGALEDEAALARLMAGVDLVVHVAGLVKARGRAAFFAVNAEGAARVARVARDVAPRARFVLISSLAARVPALSDYAASKRAGEDEVRALYGDEALILRPPAVYGPPDRETLALFKAARLPVVPLTGRGRVAMIYGADAGAAVAAAALSGVRGCFALADERPEGYEMAEILRAAARAQGREPWALLPVPGPVLRGLGAVSGALGAVRGRAVMFTAQKARELAHPDWGVSAAELLARGVYEPRTSLAEGLAMSVAWYRDQGWLERDAL